MYNLTPNLPPCVTCYPLALLCVLAYYNDSRGEEMEAPKALPSPTSQPSSLLNTMTTTYVITQSHTGTASSWGEVEWEAGEVVEVEASTTLDDMGINPEYAEKQ